MANVRLSKRAKKLFENDSTVRGKIMYALATKAVEACSKDGIHVYHNGKRITVKTLKP